MKWIADSARSVTRLDERYTISRASTGPRVSAYTLVENTSPPRIVHVVRNVEDVAVAQRLAMEELKGMCEHE